MGEPKLDPNTKRLQQRYGLTAEDYAALMEAQGDVCALCGKPPTPKRALVVSYSETTRLVRGLVHKACRPTKRVADFIERPAGYALGMRVPVELDERAAKWETSRNRTKPAEQETG